MFNVKRSMQRIGKDEAGITALETAIILIAFVVVASVFAFTVLSAGAFSTERGKEVAYASLSQARSTLELKGSVLAISSRTGTSGTVDHLIFSVANSVGEPVNLSDIERTVYIEYRDPIQQKIIANWSIAWKVRNDEDDLLESGELVEISVPVGNLITPLTINTEFTIKVATSTGILLDFQRTMPAHTDSVYDLR